MGTRLLRFGGFDFTAYQSSAGQPLGTVTSLLAVDDVGCAPVVRG